MPQELDEISKKFAQQQIIPVAKDFDKSGEFPWDIIKSAQWELHSPSDMQRHGSHEHAHSRAVWWSWFGFH
jgi:hypothetical protein